ncbi:hypothetical protein BCV70DRAFT_99149 [Testicularia cyperi]|uniref:AhpC-TSA-domain-containing protein n=1 Tax=Testicularia cyperi TaxID=1882483 RepID=A0A317XRF3_9BASI|nr:hypothetical protein BCV70DRAFT_99149 [Testicularia cyperi]
MADASTTHQALPTAEQLDAAKSTSVLDAAQSAVSFGSILDAARDSHIPLVLVFTRHFHCGMCREFVRALGQSSTLTDSSKVSVAIVGPGQAEAIEYYKKEVGSPPFHFFADPQVQFYHALGMTTRTFDGGDDKKDPIPSHHKSGLISGAVTSALGMIKSGSMATKGGDFKQLGGDFVFNADGQPVLAHRMRHTRDHTEVSELEKAIAAATSSQ